MPLPGIGTHQLFSAASTSTAFCLLLLPNIHSQWIRTQAPPTQDAVAEQTWVAQSCMHMEVSSGQRRQGVQGDAGKAFMGTRTSTAGDSTSTSLAELGLNLPLWPHPRDRIHLLILSWRNHLVLTTSSLVPRTLQTPSSPIRPQICLLLIGPWPLISPMPRTHVPWLLIIQVSVQCHVPERPLLSRPVYSCPSHTLSPPYIGYFMVLSAL